jgi:hypothetical protein
MPRPPASPDLIVSHYTRVAGIGDAANGASKALWVMPDAATQPKEITMYRIFSAAAVLALTITAAQAGASDPLTARIHDAAVAACNPERVSGALPTSHYGSIDEQCVYRISQSAMTKYQTLAKTGTHDKLASD